MPLVYLLSLIPFRLMYLFSDILAWTAFHLVKYRRREVEDNLRSSFPEKEDRELRRIAKGFYRFLGDYIVETVKLASMSEKNMRKRLKIENIDLVNDAVEKGQSVSIYLGHYCNWEWVSSLPLHISEKAECAQVYHPLENKTFDNILYKLRTRFKANNIAMSDILPALVKWKKEGVPSVTGYIADQAPGFNIHLFIEFLNHDTGVYTGAERISKFLGARAVYASLSRPKRGYYILKFLPIEDNVKKSSIFDTTTHYFKLLEEDIRRAPQYWLWSHRRWKRSREQFMQIHGNKAEDMLTHL